MHAQPLVHEETVLLSALARRAGDMGCGGGAGARCASGAADGTAHCDQDVADLAEDTAGGDRGLTDPAVDYNAKREVDSADPAGGGEATGHEHPTGLAVRSKRLLE